MGEFDERTVLGEVQCSNGHPGEGDHRRRPASVPGALLAVQRGGRADSTDFRQKAREIDRSWKDLHNRLVHSKSTHESEPARCSKGMTGSR